MSDTARDYQTSFPPTVEGLDDLFADATQCEAVDLQCSEVATQIFADATQCEFTIVEASQLLNVSPSTIYRRIKAGKYTTSSDSNGALKVLLPRIASQREAVASQIFADATPCEAVDLQCDAVATHPDELAKALVEMSYKLQHATYRNGWLESKLEEFQKDIEQRDQQIKLLTDSQHKCGWWSRFAHWFIGR